MLSLRVPSLTDEDVDIVDVYVQHNTSSAQTLAHPPHCLLAAGCGLTIYSKNIGAGGAVGLRDINGSDAVRAKAISTTARMATGKVVAIQVPCVCCCHGNGTAAQQVS